MSVGPEPRLAVEGNPDLEGELVVDALEMATGAHRRLRLHRGALHADQAPPDARLPHWLGVLVKPPNEANLVMTNYREIGEKAVNPD
jgi:hypothetical protein